MKWFKHDSNANTDAKLKRVRMKYGLEGYGLYWYCLELIAGSVDRNNITFELEHDSEIIAHDTGIHHERVNEMMSFMVSVGLFENCEGSIRCVKMAKRLDQSMASGAEMRAIIKQIKSESHDPIMIPSGHHHDTIMQDKKRRDKNKTLAKFTTPTLQQVTEYCHSRSSSVDPEKFCDYYEANGWVLGNGKPMKSWQAVVRTWERRDRPQGEDRRKNKSFHEDDPRAWV